MKILSKSMRQQKSARCTRGGWSIYKFINNTHNNNKTIFQQQYHIYMLLSDFKQKETEVFQNGIKKKLQATWSLVEFLASV